MDKKKYLKLVQQNCYFELKEKIEQKEKRDREDLDYYILCLKKLAIYELADKLMSEYCLPLKEETLAAISQKRLLLNMQTDAYISVIESTNYWLSEKVNFEKITDEDLIAANNQSFSREIAFELMLRSFRNNHSLGVAYFINQLINDGAINTSIIEGLAWLFKQFQNELLILKLCEIAKKIENIDIERISYIEAEALIATGRLTNAKKILSKQTQIETNVKNQLLLLKMYRQLSDEKNQLCVLKKLLNKNILTEETLTAALKNKKIIEQETINNAEIYLKQNPASYALIRALAEVAENKGSYSRAYSLYKKSADISKKTRKFNRNEFILKLNQIKFVREMLENLELEERRCGNAVFIVGLPRSGTTLTEKLVYSCGGYNALGESEGISRFINAFGYPTTKDSICKFIDYYYSSNFISSDENFIDKNPANFLYLDLIRKAWPDAKIIYCTKHEKINAWSLYKSRFSGDTYNYSNDKQEIEFVIRSERRLLEEYKRIHPDIFVLENEKLILENERTIGALENYIGGVINFDNSKQYLAKTMSAGQLSKIRKTLDTSYKFYAQYWSYLLDS